MRIRNVLIAGMALMAVGCGNKTQPQRPTFLGQTATDSTSVNLMLMHQTMAEKADSQLAQMATDEYVLMDENYWVKGLKGMAEDAPSIQEGEYVEVEIEIYDLKDNLLCVHQANVRMGQVDEIQAVVLVLPQMKRTMSVSMLVPWYLAFGSAGNTEVPPYENVRVELKVK